MKRQLALVVDLGRCIGCHACTVACKQEHDLPVGLAWNPVLTVGPVGTFPNVSTCYLPKQCMHCGQAPCIEACPTGAIAKSENVLILIETEKCNGCGFCVDACPYDAVSINPTSGLAEKCTFCFHRVDKGLQPACVLSCVGKAMFFGDTEDPSDRVYHLLRDQAHRAFRLWPEMETSPSVIYLRARNYIGDIPRDVLGRRPASQEAVPVKWLPPAWPRREEADKVVRTACLDCHSRCGALVHVKDGVVMKVEGNPEHPLSRGIMCAKGSAVRQILYHPERLNYPLRRTRPKGDHDPGWRRITWDEALDTIAQRLLRYKEEFGAESVCFGFGTGRETNQYCFRIMNTFGSPHRTGFVHTCTGPQSAASRIVWGGGMHGVEPDFANASCIVLWGFNPAYSFPAQTQHIFDAMDKGAKLIVVDPLYTPLASQAHIWLPLRPGSDGALALAWMNVIVNEKLYDAEFVKRWTNGPFLVRVGNAKLLVEGDIVPGGDPKKYMVWDEARNTIVAFDTPDSNPALTGNRSVKGIGCRPAWELLIDRLSDYTPESVAATTWLQADRIREAARLYATSKPSALGMHLGVTQHSNGFQNNLALNQLIAICGNIDLPGSNVDWPVGINRWFAMGWPAIEALPPGMVEKRLGTKEAPLLTAGVFPCSHYTQVWEAITSGKPYPIKAMVTVASNILAAVENPKDAYKALKKLDFFVVMDYFMTPTAELADIVLPAAHWTERDNLSEEVCKNFITARRRSIAPMYERWPDEKFYNELAKRLGLGKYWWRDVEDILNWELQQFGITWDQMKEKYILEVPKRFRSYEESGFKTPTKRVEIYSTKLGNLGFDPLPFFEEPVYSPYRTPDLAKDYPLILNVGGRLPGYYHSAYRNIPWLRELAPEPEVHVNPTTAAEFGLQHGDWAWVETPFGRIKQKVHLSEGVHPRVVQVYHGWWQGCKELGKEGYGWDGANANILIDNKHNDPHTGTPPMRASLCKVYKA